MAKRTYNTGAVYRRSDGRWEGQLRTPDRRRKSVYAYTRRDALARLREAQWAVAQGLPVSSRNQTLAEFLDGPREQRRLKFVATPQSAWEVVALVVRLALLGA
jgi:hypothetical protein